MGSQLSTLVEQAKENGGNKPEISILKIKANKDKDLLTAIEDLVRQVPNLHILTAKECKIQKLPQELAYLASLAVLNLEHNKLTTLPAMAKLDAHLRELHLPQNKFITFPTTLSELPHLEVLDLSNNAIAEIPKEIEKMKALRSLALAKNALTAFSTSVCLLPALTSLDLSDNRIPTVPKQISSLQSLETLVLRRNALSHLPVELCACVALTNLDVSENQLLSLPEEIGKLAGLTVLSAQHNKISQLPSQIGELVQLRNLKLHDNQLEHLPTTLGQLTNLTEICLQENELQELPAEVGGCTSLRKLYAEYNRLSSLPAEFSRLDNLVVLILHHNRLKEVPEALVGMRQLLRLSLDSNPLPEHVQEVIQTKGALGLLAEKAGTTGSSIGTLRGSLRNQLASSTQVVVSPVAGSRGSVILSPRIGLEKLQEMKKGLLPLLKGEQSPRKSGSLEVENAPGDTTSILSRLRASSLTSEKLRSLSTPAKVDSPEDEMKKFVEARRKTLRGRNAGQGSTIGGSEDLSSGPTVLRSHSASEGVVAHKPAAAAGEDEAQEKKEEKEEDIPSYSKFKYAFERMLTTQDFSSRRQETLKKLPANQKWKLLTQYKGSTLEMLKDTRSMRGKGKAAMEPQDYVPLLKGRPSTRDLEGLSTALEGQASSWVAMFVEAGGIEALVALLNTTALKLRLSQEDADVILHALTALKTLLGLSLRSVLTTYESVNCMVICAGLDNVQVRTLALEVIAMVLDVHYVGQRLVHAAFHNYKRVMLKDKNVSRFASLMEPLIQSAYPTEALVNAMDIINTLIGDEEDLEARLDIRKEFVQLGIIELMEKLRLYSSELLHIQLDLFEDELEGDFEEMLSKFEKKKVLQRMESQGHASVAEGAYLRVLLGHTGQQLVVPFEPTTTVATAIDIILQKQPLSRPQDIKYYGIYNSSAGAWLDDPSALLCSLGSGEIVCEFKMRPLRLAVTKGKSVAGSSDDQRRDVSVDPNTTVSSALALALQQFGLSTDAEGEDYGLVLSSTAKAGEVCWLEDMKKLGEYKELFSAPRLSLRRKPWLLKVSFPGHTVEEMPFEPDLKIADVIEQIIGRLTGPSQMAISSQDYGLFIRRKTHKGVWLKPTRSLADYPELFAHRKVRPVELMLKPRSVVVVLPDKQRTMKLHFTDPVESLLEKICTKASLPVQQHSLYLQRAHKQTTSGADNNEDQMYLLNPAASLKEQNVPYTAVLVLGPKQEFVPKPKSEKTGRWSQNIWEEPSGDNYIQWEDASRATVRAGTLNKLVQHLTSEQGLFKAYDDAFIMTFQSFCEPDELLDKFMERFNAPPNVDNAIVKKIQLRVCIAIRDFIQAHYNSLGFPDCPLAVRINDFINDKLNTTEGMQMHASMLQKAISTPPSKVIALAAPSSSKFKLRNMSDSISLFDMEELEVAKQLTLRTWDIYAKFQPLEFFKTAWSKPSTWHLSPNLLAAINFFNHVSLWVGTMIVTMDKVRERAKIMTRCIKIAQHLREMNNYQLVMAFVSGMNNSALLRLKWTRAKLPKRALTTLKELEELMSMEGSFKGYRAALEASSPPCIPYVGVYLTDLTFIEDGNADDVVVDGEKPMELINFTKRILVYSIISTILRYQQQPYGITRHEEIQTWFDSITPLNENELYAQSLKIEPRGVGRADIQ